MIKSDSAIELLVLVDHAVADKERKPRAANGNFFLWVSGSTSAL